MKREERTVYRCDTCNIPYSTEEKALDCERQHARQETCAHDFEYSYRDWSDEPLEITRKCLICKLKESRYVRSLPEGLLPEVYKANE